MTGIIIFVVFLFNTCKAGLTLDSDAQVLETAKASGLIKTEILTKKSIGSLDSYGCKKGYNIYYEIKGVDKFSHRTSIMKICGNWTNTFVAESIP